MSTAATNDASGTGRQAPSLPLGSLTLSSSVGGLQRCSSSTRTLRSVPALHASTSARRGLSPAALGGQRSMPALPSSRSAVPKQQQQQRAGRRFRPWHLPLAAAALVFRAARSAARVLTPALPRHQPSRVSPSALGSSRVFPSLLPKRIGGGSSSRPGVPAGRKPAVVWFRNDLRLHDHEPLAAACAGSTSVLPVYVFDPREYGKSPNGFDKTGPYRARFILEALTDLRARLRDAGSDLVVRIGKPEEVLPQLVRAVGAAGVYCHGEVTAEEGKVEAAVARALDKAGAALKVMWGGTLFHVEDLPFQLPSMPPHYSDFRKAVRSLAVRAPLDTPAQVKGLPAASVPAGELPSLQQLGFDAATLQRCASDASAAGARLRGGESEALRRLTDFITHFTHPGTNDAGASTSSSSGGSARARQRGAAAAAPNFCCKVSPWLALGCLSPRQLYGQLQQKLSGQQQQLRAAGQGADADMQWLLYELLWRDFFRFITKKYSIAGVPQRSQPPAAVPAMA